LPASSRNAGSTDRIRLRTWGGMGRRMLGEIRRSARPIVPGPAPLSVSLDTRLREPHISAMPHSPIENRHDQMFPVLDTAEIGRISRLGERRAYAAGARIFTTGEIAPGAFVLLSGHVEITQRDRHREIESIVTHGPGSFMGE